ncbi:PadR family transcriptional regulator [Gorillibacterium timonense]|uniref:PadR family transcriptional regulator n=1 Tax=Gorillibacterium timonense TaxID=1689269 RepID=UPI00071D021B|nr:PadR family transcriptional regulator [Gorillibacterium timonense]
MNESSQLKKGVLEILVLHLLSGADLYGYQLISELDARSRSFFRMKEGTLYPVLYRLEDGGFISSYWEKESEKRGVPRKYYRITPEGKERERELKEDLELFVQSIKLVLEGEP